MKTRTFREFAKALVGGLNKGKFTYAITGALAASYYGTPRTTVDADFIIHLASKEYDRLLALMESLGLKVDRPRIQHQLKSGYKTITLRDKSSPHKADLTLQTTGKLESRTGSFLGQRAHYLIPEALILAKLRMVKATRPKERSLKDREDIKAMISNTRVKMARIIRDSKKETTANILHDIVSTLQPKSKRRRRGSE